MMIVLSLGVHDAAGFSVFSPLPSSMDLRRNEQQRRLGTTRLVAMSSEVKSTESEVTPMKSTLMRLLSRGTGLKAAADTGNRAQVNELVIALEKNNPTNEPAASELLNGLSLSLSRSRSHTHTSSPCARA